MKGDQRSPTTIYDSITNRKASRKSELWLNQDKRKTFARNAFNRLVVHSFDLPTFTHIPASVSILPEQRPNRKCFLSAKKRCKGQSTPSSSYGTRDSWAVDCFDCPRPSPSLSAAESGVANRTVVGIGEVSHKSTIPQSLLLSGIGLLAFRLLHKLTERSCILDFIDECKLHTFSADEGVDAAGEESS